MSSGDKREPHATTTASFSAGPLHATTGPKTGGLSSRGSARVLASGPQHIPPNQQVQSPQMAVHQPLQPAIPPMYSHHRGQISGDSSSSRTSFPSPLPSTAHLEEATSPEGAPTRPLGRRDAAQGRVFRQRRKDPSCDACRERKVKCDATTSGSCSECIGRGIICQFTNDSNRRMSSIKQVQELQRQLGQTRRENERLRLMLTPGDRMELDSPDPSPITGYHTRRRSGRTQQTYTQATRNIGRYSRNIFKPPPAYRHRAPQPTTSFDKSSLPDGSKVSELIEACRNTFVKDLSIVEWETFLGEVGSLYNVEGVQSVSTPWLALLFSTLALGSLQTIDAPEMQRTSAELIRRAVEQLNVADNEICLDHCRAALMISIYYFEAAQRSTAWLWLSLTVSMAFDMGLHEEIQSTASQEDAETRRSIWWTIYIWERLLSLELSRPLLIDDDDIKVTLPVTAHGTGGHHEVSVVTSATPLMRLYGVLRRMLRTSDTSWATLMTFESLLEPVASSYPSPALQPRSTNNDTNFLHFTILLSNARLILYRQNLIPTKQVEERLAALESCVSAAHATTQCVSDSMHRANQAGSLSSTSADSIRFEWAKWIRSAASSVMCAHLWRCILVLSFAQDFSSALVCARACKAIGILRELNILCGRQLLFFLNRILNTPGQGEVRKQNLAEDLEMLAYVTGDMQGDSHRAWVWSESDISRPASQLGPTSESNEMSDPPDATHDGQVWAEVESLLERLHGERTLQRPLPEFDIEPGAPVEPQGGARLRRRNSSSRKRMSIANII